MKTYSPLPAEYFVTGLIGLSLYLSIIYLSVSSLWSGVKSKSTRNFFICVIGMALLELPRYLIMVIEQQYTSRIGYGFHIVSGVFFFAAFSIVCRQWSGLLQMGTYVSAVYGKRGLIISNVAFGIVDCSALIVCAMDHSLQSYFNSQGFEVLTFIEGIRNCVYSSFLSYYGIKLLKRFWHFSKIEQQSMKKANMPNITELFCWKTQTRNSGVGQEPVFTKVVIRLTAVLLLSTICFAVRVCMLIAKMAIIHSYSSITTKNFTLFGVLWFTFSDFIPRATPTLAFIFLMRTKRPANEQTKDIPNMKNNEQKDFQFIELPGDETDYDNNSMLGSISKDDLHKSDHFVDDLHTIHFNSDLRLGNTSDRNESHNPLNFSIETGSGDEDGDGDANRHTNAISCNYSEDDSIEYENATHDGGAMDRFFTMITMKPSSPDRRLMIDKNNDFESSSPVRK
eukprot:gene14907-20051_t